MKKCKKIGVVFAVIVIAVGLGLLIRYRWTLPSDEINRARLNELMEQKMVLSAAVSPTPYSGIYTVEGSWKSGPKPGKFSITTHLDDAQVKTLLDSAEAKVDVPGRPGNRGQWVSIISSLVISGLVVSLVVH